MTLAVTTSQSDEETKPRKPYRKRPANSAEFFSIPELARKLGTCQKTLRQALRRGQVPSRRLGIRYLLPRPLIENWLSQVAVPPIASDIR